MRSSPRSSGHLGLLQPFVIVQKLSGCFCSTSNEGLGILAGLSDLDNVLQLFLSDLCRRENQFATAPNGLGFFQLLNLGVTSRHELGLVRSFALAISLALTLPPFGFFILGFTLVFETAERLADRSRRRTSLFVRGIVKSGGWLLLEGNVCVVLHPALACIERHNKRLAHIHSLLLSLMAHTGASLGFVLTKKLGVHLHDASGLKLALLLEDSEPSCLLELPFTRLALRLLALGIGKTSTSFGKHLLLCARMRIQAHYAQ